MTTEKTMASTCELAQRNTIRAFRSGPKVVIVAEGDLPSPGYDAKITQRPEKVFPPWYQGTALPAPGFLSHCARAVPRLTDDQPSRGPGRCDGLSRRR